MDLVFPQKVETIEETDRYGKFVLSPYSRGYGHTVGNSLRRILLSSLEGAAITACRIEGVKHELSTIKGVKEDVIYILQNLKKLRFKLYSDGPEILKLHAKGEKIVTAKDIEKNPNVDILTPDETIATLSKDGEIKMEMELRKGRGYVLSQENKRPEAPKYTLALDAMFSPISKVNYKIENVRIGTKMDYEKIIMEIWTDGSIKPSEALAYAAKILIDSLKPLIAPVEEKEEIKPLAEIVQKEKITEYLKQPIEILNLSTRALNALKSSNINLIDDLVKKTDDELLEIENFGETSLKEVKNKLKQLGLSLSIGT